MTMLKVSAVVKLKEDVLEAINNYSLKDTPFTSSIGNKPMNSTFTEWQRDVYATPSDNAALEGAAAVSGTSVQPGLLNNRSQILEKTISVSGTSEAVKKYGRDKEYKRQLIKKAIELKGDIEFAALSNGATVTDNGSVAGKMRGLHGFITNDVFGAGGASPDPTTNTAPTSGTDVALTEAMIKNAQQSCWENGGDGSVLSCSPAHKAKISTFTFGVSRTHEVSTKMADTQPISFDFIRGDFGVIKVVPNRVQAIAQVGLNDTLYLYDPDKAANLVLRGMQTKELGAVGDSQQWQMLCEQSLWVGDERAFYAIRDITVSGS